MIIKFEDKKKLGDKLCQDQAGQLNKFVSFCKFRNVKSKVLEVRSMK